MSKGKIECFHSRGQHLCKFIGTKGSVCIRKEFNSQRIVLGHQHGRRDVMRKHSIVLRPIFTWRVTSRDLVSRLASRSKKLAPLTIGFMKLDSAVVSMGFSGLCHLLAIFLDSTTSSWCSLLISKPTLWRPNNFVVFFGLGVEDENGQALFSSLEAFTFKLPGKTVSTRVSTILVNHDFCQIAWLAWFNSGTRIKYDRTCQRSIKIISIEETFALHKSAQKKHFFLEFFFTRKLLMSSI